MKIAGLSLSIYYVYASKIYPDVKNDELMGEIIEIYYEHKIRYGYRRITLELINRGIRVYQEESPANHE